VDKPGVTGIEPESPGVVGEWLLEVGYLGWERIDEDGYGVESVEKTKGKSNNGVKDSSDDLGGWDRVFKYTTYFETPGPHLPG
jgi:hypothetical protein